MKFVPNTVSRAVTRQALAVQQNSPKILFAAGVVGFVGTAVLAARATLKLDETLDVTNKKYQDVKQAQLDGVLSDQDYQRILTSVYFQGTVQVVKLYAPTLILGTASIAALTKSHNIMAQRNASITAAYIAVDRAFSEYRARVATEIGEDREKELRYDVQNQELTKFNTAGEAIDRKKTKTFGPGGTSMYARIFSRDTTRMWEREPHYNVAFLKLQQSLLTDRLHAKGILLLNDVYDTLGLDRTEAGGIVGWVYGDGDNFVDFGIFKDEKREAFLDFMTGREEEILLDFNVDGPVLERYSKMSLRRK